jgi:UDP-N-acetylglucosamine transferase subunit ALG13
MILVTVGTQLPFDRLVAAVDGWAAYAGRTDVFMQTGNGSYCPKQSDHAGFLAPAEFEKKVQDSKLIIAHCGMGSILTALELSKPAVVLAREARYGEHRNDHQLATAEKFRGMPNIFVASRESEVPKLIEEALSTSVSRDNSLPPVASREFISTVASFIENTGIS